MNYEFAGPGPVTADIRLAGGALHVDAAERDVITVSVEPFDNSSASREAAEQTRVALEGRNLIVHAPNLKGWALLRWPRLNIRVAIPQESMLTLKSASADIKCAGVYADAEVHTASGDLQIDRVIKDVSVKSASGDIGLGWVGGTLRVTSASGDIAVQHIVKDAELNSASGDIEVGRAERDVRAKTASGDVEIGIAH